MLMASMPVAVIMQRRVVQHRWATSLSWSVAGVVSCPPGLTDVQSLQWYDDQESFLFPGLQLELHRDEDDGYFENWAAPQPRIFVMWQIKDERAVPVSVSVSYGEGTRMLDSGDYADGVAMPPDIHAWLTVYLQAHYQPKPRRGRGHG